MRISLSFVALLASASALQAQPAPKVDCAKGASSTVEINYCAEKDLDAAGKRLNAAYRAYLAAIAKNGLDPKPDKEWREAIQEAQRKWIAFRDADCKGATSYEWYGGTGATAAILGCMKELTLARVKDLTERAATK